MAHDPTEGLMVRLPDPEAPAPFTRAEIKQILETHTSRTQELLMIQFMMWAGPRVSETIAPAWDALQKIDALNRKRKAETVDIVERDNKTLRQHKLHFVLLNTKSGLPHVSDFVIRDGFFEAHLLAAWVRYRGPGQRRHT